jgi:hypothetical protein
MKKLLLCLIPLFLAIGIIIISCKKDVITTIKVAPAKDTTGNVTLSFAHYVNGNPVQLDTMIYTNAAGNLYEIDDFKYFISNVQFHKSNGIVKNINTCTWNYYVDNTIPSSLTWDICDKLPVGTYDTISFRFGFANAQNQTNMFLNPPESNMFWPMMLGGGYHYMQLDGKWRDSINQIENFNTHLGIGRVIYGSDTIFVDNSFIVKLPVSFTLTATTTPVVQIIMNIDRWYNNPYVFDFNYYGQMIMMNQDAMHKISANGWDVFTVGAVH